MAGRIWCLGPSLLTPGTEVTRGPFSSSLGIKRPLYSVSPRLTSLINNLLDVPAVLPRDLGRFPDLEPRSLRPTQWWAAKHPASEPLSTDTHSMTVEGWGGGQHFLDIPSSSRTMGNAAGELPSTGVSVHHSPLSAPSTASCKAWPRNQLLALPPQQETHPCTELI